LLIEENLAGIDAIKKALAPERRMSDGLEEFNMSQN
jgi:hypothetical protein